MPSPFSVFFDVTASLRIYATGLDVLIQNLDGEGLRIDWTVTRTRTSTPDTATVVVSNLAPETRKLLASVYQSPAVAGDTPLSAEISAGWGRKGEAGYLPPERLFAGQAWKLTPANRESVTVVTSLELGDGMRQMRDTPVLGADFVDSAGLTWSGFVNTVLQAMAGVFSGSAADPTKQSIWISEAAKQTIDAAAAAKQLSVVDVLGRSVVNAGRDLGALLDDVFATLGLAWKIDSSQLIVLDRNGLRNDAPDVILGIDSGLLSWTSEDDGAVRFRALANPLAVVGAKLEVRDENGAPVGASPLRIESLTFTGSTSGSSTMDGIGRGLAFA